MLPQAIEWAVISSHIDAISFRLSFTATTPRGWLKVNTTQIAQIIEKLKHFHGSQSRTKLYIFPR